MDRGEVRRGGEFGGEWMLQVNFFEGVKVLGDLKSSRVLIE